MRLPEALERTSPRTQSVLIGLAVLGLRALAEPPSAAALSCRWISGHNFSCPCSGLPSCYPANNCTGVHLDGCPTGFTSTGRWWCCCDGELLDCTDCAKSGSPSCICQGIYQTTC